MADKELESIRIVNHHTSCNKRSATSHSYYIGVDVGSTTVKGVVMDDSLSILYNSYKRHEGRQAETVVEFLSAINGKFGEADISLYITGSGGSSIANALGCRYVQEVNAVALAVERLYPNAGSVIEIGGQDAKVIIWSVDPATGKKRKFTSMNNKCAGGTGAVIDRIAGKLNITQQRFADIEYNGVKLHPVAARCGVFAEMDINGLQKQGIPSEELIASLFDAIVQQNLNVLTYGNIINPDVLLLGGPNTFIPAMRQVWQRHISALWEQRNIHIDDPASHIIVPENAQFFAAVGSVVYGMEDEAESIFKGTDALERYLSGRRGTANDSSVMSPRMQKDFEMVLKRSFGSVNKTAHYFKEGEVVRAYLGIDAGSTSTKGVLVGEDGEVIERSYLLSQGNPLDDTKRIILNLNHAVTKNGAILEILGVGTTGYAKDLIKEAINADVAIVETVAHTKSALHFYGDIDVICDVGGQDIKIIFLDNGRVKDFRLNTQCSAGNGYFLQNTANRFGYDVTQYAEAAFEAERYPVFNYGCAVFLEADIVNFQQRGFSPKEIMAGLAEVLPKNIWFYVVQESNIGKFGKNFVLQGGTHYNLAVVRSQYNFIKSRIPDANIIVHKYAGESGAIGAAIETIQVLGGKKSTFAGMETIGNLTYSIQQNQSTQCSFCIKKCRRTFVTTNNGGRQGRFIVAPCEKGMAENLDDMRITKKHIDRIKKENPDFADIVASKVFSSDIGTVTHAYKSWSPDALRHITGGKYLLRRKQMRIGIPKILNMYSTAPFFIGYLRSIGLPAENIIFSDTTNDAMYKHGSRRGSIDQCFPSKVAISHVHNLIYKKKVDLIFLPILITLKTELVNTLNSYACPSATITPEVIKAAFTKQENVFEQHGIEYLTPVFNMSEQKLFAVQMYGFFKKLFGVSRRENIRAIEAGEYALKQFYNELRHYAGEVIEKLEKEQRVGIVILGRPYHADPGINHEILSELQKLGYPIFTIESLPVDRKTLLKLFGGEIASKENIHPMSINDVWKNSYSENTNKKLWAAKYTARHRNLVAVDLSNFRCGNDAPIYNIVESILKASDTPYFTFHDIDENKPSGSIKIRIETVNYFLKQYTEQLRSRHAESKTNVIHIPSYQETEPDRIMELGK